MERDTAADAKRDQISIDRCRDLLGDEAHGLSDEGVDLIRRHADAMAHVIVEIFMERGGAKESSP